MAGQYFDPLTVDCPFCKTKAAYPLKDLENYQAVCVHCTKSLVQVSRQMDQSRQSHSSELWDYWLKLDLFDDYLLDESLTDEEFDNLSTLGELIAVLKRYDPTASFESLSQHPKLSSAIKILSNQPADTISLNDLAILQTSARRPPFNQFALVGARIFTGEDFLDDHTVIICGDKIEAIIPAQNLSDQIQQIPLMKGVLTPGFIDLHAKGSDGKFFTDDTSLSRIKFLLDAHRSKGTTSLLPTAIEESFAIRQQAANSVLTAIKAGFKGVLGLHIAHAEKFIHETELNPIDWLKNFAHSDLKILLTAEHRPDLLIFNETITEIGKSDTLVNQEKLNAGETGLIDAVKYAHETLQIDLAECLRMASLYPARCLKLDHQLGKIQPDYRADLVHITEDFSVDSTWVAGDWRIHK